MNGRHSVPPVRSARYLIAGYLRTVLYPHPPRLALLPFPRTRIDPPDWVVELNLALER
jgi:hypothetical protein